MWGTLPLPSEASKERSRIADPMTVDVGMILKGYTEDGCGQVGQLDVAQLTSESFDSILFVREVWGIWGNMMKNLV